MVSKQFWIVLTRMPDTLQTFSEEHSGGLSTDYYQRLTLESWFTNLEQTPLNRCQQLPAPYKRLINDTKTDKQ